MGFRARTTMLPKNVDPPYGELPGNMAISREYRVLFQEGCGTLLVINTSWTCSSFSCGVNESNSAEM